MRSLRTSALRRRLNGKYAAECKTAASDGVTHAQYLYI
jgi:hypothetical protein